MHDQLECKICALKTDYIFSARLLKKYDAKYYHCPNCGFLQTEEPYWLSEAYNSAIGAEDTGILKRNSFFSKRVSILLNFFFNKEGKFLDYAGGYGIFVRLMRDIGFNFYWSDPFAANLVSRGFEYNGSDTIELVTALEAFEHFINPIQEIEKILSHSHSIMFSTRVFKNNPPDPNSWWYYSFNSGQHISLYSIKTLYFIADKFNLHLNTDYKSFHLLSTLKINNILFNILVKLSSLGLSQIANLRMNSRTDSDFELLIKK